MEVSKLTQNIFFLWNNKHFLSLPTEKAKKLTQPMVTSTPSVQLMVSQNHFPLNTVLLGETVDATYRTGQKLETHLYKKAGDYQTVCHHEKPNLKGGLPLAKDGTV